MIWDWMIGDWGLVDLRFDEGMVFVSLDWMIGDWGLVD